MTLNTRVEFPNNVNVLTETGKFSPAFARYIQGIYDIQGASTGQIQFSRNSVQLKNGTGPVKINDSNVSLGNVPFLQNNAVISNTILGVETAGAVDLVPVASSGVGGKTGQVKFLLRTDEITGWIRLQEGTIGNTSSGATILASNATEKLFVLLWNLFDDTTSPVSGGRGETGTADFNANKTIQLPKLNSRVFMNTATSTELGTGAGAETHLLVEEEEPEHTHTFPYGPPSTSAPGTNYFILSPANVGTTNRQLPSSLNMAVGNGGSNTAQTWTKDAYEQNEFGELEEGDSEQVAHENRQPSVAMSAYIKL